MPGQSFPGKEEGESLLGRRGRWQSGPPGSRGLEQGFEGEAEKSVSEDWERQAVKVPLLPGMAPAEPRLGEGGGGRVLNPGEKS